jgi:hypothetical protein
VALIDQLLIVAAGLTFGGAIMAAFRYWRGTL